MRQTIRLTESELRRMIAESIKDTLKDSEKEVDESMNEEEEEYPRKLYFSKYNPRTGVQTTDSGRKFGLRKPGNRKFDLRKDKDVDEAIDRTVSESLRRLRRFY